MSSRGSGTLSSARIGPWNLDLRFPEVERKLYKAMSAFCRVIVRLLLSMQRSNASTLRASFACRVCFRINETSGTNTAVCTVNGAAAAAAVSVVVRVGALVGWDGCEVRLCDPCARVRPCLSTHLSHVSVPAPPGARCLLTYAVLACNNRKRHACDAQFAWGRCLIWGVFDTCDTFDTLPVFFRSRVFYRYFFVQVPVSPRDG